MVEAVRQGHQWVLEAPEVEAVDTALVEVQLLGGLVVVLAAAVVLELVEPVSAFQI
jgi:hypothetical protein